MHDGEDFDAVLQNSIDEPVAADEDLPDRGVAQLRDDSAAFGEAVERTSGIAGLREEGGGVVR
jgi:hypothetical protein